MLRSVSRRQTIELGVAKKTLNRRTKGVMLTRHCIVHLPIDSELRASLDLPCGAERDNALMLQAAFVDTNIAKG